eukprot:3870589-Prymnesium_polylepis.1
MSIVRRGSVSGVNPFRNRSTLSEACGTRACSVGQHPWPPQPWQSGGQSRTGCGRSTGRARPPRRQRTKRRLCRGSPRSPRERPPAPACSRAKGQRARPPAAYLDLLRKDVLRVAMHALRLSPHVLLLLLHVRRVRFFRSTQARRNQRLQVRARRFFLNSNGLVQIVPPSFFSGWPVTVPLRMDTPYVAGH